jgi:PAS domain S-box-containing protein
MINLFKSWLQSRVSFNKDLEILSIGQFKRLMEICIIYLPVSMVGNLLGGKTPAGVQIVNIVSMVTAGLLRLWVKPKNEKLVMRVALICAYLSITTNILLLGSIRNPTTSIYILWIVGAVFLFGYSGLVFSVSMTSVSVLGIIWAERAGLLPQADPSVTITQWVTLTFMFTMIGIFTYERQNALLNALKNAKNELEERRRAENNASLHQNRFQVIAENTADLIWLLRYESKKMVYFSPSVQAMLGYSPAEALALPLPRLVTEPTYSSLEKHLSSRAREYLLDHTRNNYTDEYELVHKNGKIITAEITITFITNEESQLEVIGVARDISERKYAELALRKSEELYRKAISAAGAVPYSRDYTTDKFTFMGEGYENLTGYAHLEISQVNIDHIFIENILRGELEGLPFFETTNRIRSGEIPASVPWSCDSRLIHKNGSERWISDTAVQVLDENGHPTGSIGILMDITERKLAEFTLRENSDRLKAANTALEKAARLKDEFLASMSHELRTPLTSILATSESLILDTYGPLAESQRKAVRRIDGNSRHLLGLINDILDLAKIEAGRLDFQMQACTLIEICQASLQMTRGLALQKNQKVSFSMQQPNLVVRADPRRLKQVLVNLLSNAIKFTPEGGSLGLIVSTQPQDQNLIITVWDNGVGIAAEDLPKLFQSFVQLDSSLARQSSGTGLGLALVRRMTELMGGSVNVQSTPGQGSRFSVILPWSIVPLPTNPPATIGPRQIQTAFLIDDNPVDAMQTTRYLRDLGIKTFRHFIMRSASERASQYKPDIILLDLNLYDRTGLDMLQQLQTRAETREIPVLVLCSEENRSSTTTTGAQGFLVKPFSQGELEAELNRICSSARKHANPSQLEDTLQLLTIMAVDDNESLLESISEYFSKHKYHVINCHSAVECLGILPEALPDLILADIQMPGMDGLELIRQIRASSNQKLATLPIIAFTALSMQGDRERCLEAGANAYITKPLPLVTLTRLIDQFLSSPETHPA